VIIRGSAPQTGTISWARSYDLGDAAGRLPRDLFIAAYGPDVVLSDIDAHAFYDLQTLRRGHVARTRLPPVDFDGILNLPDGDRPVRGTVAVHIIAYACGFVVIRPTLRFDRYQGDLDYAALHQLERAFWRYDYPLRWHVPGCPDGLPGGVRTLMNWAFLDLYERARGATPSPRRLAEWAYEGIQGCDRLHELYAAGRLSYPFPVSFGTQFELVEPAFDGTDRLPRRIAPALLRADPGDLTAEPVNVEDDSDLVCWYLEENQALTLTGTGRVDDELDVVDIDRTQLLEFLALRRATLRCVQRDTQRVLTERLQVTRAQIEHWQHIVASTTDDYVLHDRIGRLIEPLRRHYAQEVRMRDIRHLEEQVRANLAWFQERIDTAADWTGGLVGAAVGAAALVISLQDVVRIVIATLVGVPPGQVGERYGLLIAAALLVLVLLSFLGSLLVIKRLSSRLRPFSAWRIDRRRRWFA